MGITGALTGAAAPSAAEGVQKLTTVQTPQAVPPPPPPSPSSAETQESLKEARERERKARGRAATILTGGQGLEGSPTTSRRTLLGA